MQGTATNRFDRRLTLTKPPIGDESGFRADTVHGKTWAPKGKTPVINRPGQRQSISAASAVNAKGGFWFAT